MRVTTALKHLMRLPGVNVRGVVFGVRGVVVTVALRRRRLVCPLCPYSTRSRYDTREVDSAWRHLDLGAWALVVRARLRRLRCPDHGVRVEGVPFARWGSGFTRDFEDLVAWLAARMDKTTVTRLLRIAWRTVGKIIARVVPEEIDPDRLEELFEIGIDEIAWRKHHKYLTLVSDHATGKVVWGTEGKDTEAADRFFGELGTARSGRIRAVSMDMSPAYEKSVRKKDHAPKATICYDPFHVVALATKALDRVRRKVWNEMRRVDPEAAKRYKGARWVLLKNPENLSEEQQATWRKLRRKGGETWRAYKLKEALRAVFVPDDLSPSEAEELIEGWCQMAERSGLEPFVKLAKTIRGHLPGILAAIRLGINNARHEALNTKVRLVIRRAYGFHSAGAALALVMLACGPVALRLPFERMLG